MNLLWKNSGIYFPNLEIGKLRKIDFFPRSLLWQEMTSICIASKSRSLGDPLILSTLPTKIRAIYPHIKVYTYPRGFNRAVFFNHPHVEGVQYAPKQVFGDDCNAPGSGHLIQIKEQWFGLSVSPNPRPEIYLSAAETQWAQRYIQARRQSPRKRLCVIHPWGKTRSKVASSDFWSKVIDQNQDRFEFWQLGIQGHLPIAGCQEHFLLPTPFRHARKLFALVSQADVFVGVDSGPMHVARAFQLPSLILLDHEEENSPSPAMDKGTFLYRENRHFRVNGISSHQVLQEVEEFLSKIENNL